MRGHRGQQQSLLPGSCLESADRPGGELGRDSQELHGGEADREHRLSQLNLVGERKVIELLRSDAQQCQVALGQAGDDLGRVAAPVRQADLDGAGLSRRVLLRRGWRRKGLPALLQPVSKSLHHLLVRLAIGEVHVFLRISPMIV